MVAASFAAGSPKIVTTMSVNGTCGISGAVRAQHIARRCRHDARIQHMRAREHIDEPELRRDAMLRDHVVDRAFDRIAFTGSVRIWPMTVSVGQPPTPRFDVRGELRERARRRRQRAAEEPKRQIDRDIPRVFHARGLEDLVRARP